MIYIRHALNVLPTMVGFDNVQLNEILVELAWDMLDSAIPDIPISQNASKYLPDNISKEEIHNTLAHITTLATVFGARRSRDNASNRNRDDHRDRHTGRFGDVLTGTLSDLSLRW